MTKKKAILALGLILAGFVLMSLPAASAFAAESGPAAQSTATETATFLTSEGAAKLGFGIGFGLIIMGAASGIGRIGGSAVESMARQPEVASQIFTPMILTAALIEGATFAALILGYLALG